MVHGSFYLFRGDGYFITYLDSLPNVGPSQGLLQNLYMESETNIEQFG